MKIRFYALAGLAACAALVPAQKANFGAFSPGSPETFTGVVDVDISRTHPLDETTANNFRTYRPGRPVFGNITFEGALGDAYFDKWFQAVLDGKVERKSVSVIFRDDSGSIQRYNFFECWPCKWKYPACDSNGGKPAGMEIEVCGSFAGKKGYDYYQVGKQKQWHPANFRLKIDGLDAPCSRVNKIEALVIKQHSVGDLDGDGQGDYTSSDLVFTLPIDAAGPVIGWFDEGGLPRKAVLDYLDTDGTSMRTVECVAGAYRVSVDLGKGTVTVTCGQKITKSRSNIQNN